jgi:hypothetical protein
MLGVEIWFYFVSIFVAVLCHNGVTVLYLRLLEVYMCVSQGVQPGPLRGPVGALPRNPMVQCGFEKIAGLGVDWNLEYDMCTHEYLVNQASQVAACT